MKRTVALKFGFSDWHHSLYDELIYAPPVGYSYVVSGLSKKNIPKFFLDAYNYFKGVTGFHIANTVFDWSMKLTKIKHNGLIHFCNTIPKFEYPFVSDFESLYSFLLPSDFSTCLYDKNIYMKRKDFISELISQDSCKVIMPWSDAAKNLLLDLLGNKNVNFVKKIKTVRLACRVIQEPRRNINKMSFNILFTGTKNFNGDSNFYWRGGVRVLRIFEQFIRDKEDAYLFLTGEVPAELKKKVEGTKNVKVLGLLPEQEYKNLLSTINVLFFPSYITPGMTFHDMLKNRIPIITTNAFANKEYVSDAGIICDSKMFSNDFTHLMTISDICKYEKTLIDYELEDKLLDALNFAYNNRDEIEEMGNRGFLRVKDGELSISYRNAILKEIYDSVISEIT